MIDRALQDEGVVQVERGRVAWIDTDAGGRIHFTAAFRWVELAEAALFRRLGLLEGWAYYPRRAVQAESLAVLRFEDEIGVRLYPERVGTTSISYIWEISRHAELCIRGHHTVVHVDGDGRAVRLPKEVRAALSSMQSPKARS